LETVRTIAVVVVGNSDQVAEVDVSNSELNSREKRERK
jgi:hypothetical protein